MLFVVRHLFIIPSTSSCVVVSTFINLDSMSLSAINTSILSWFLLEPWRVASIYALLSLVLDHPQRGVDLSVVLLGLTMTPCIVVASVIACKGSGLHHGHLVRYFSLCFISCKLYTHLCKVSTPLCKCPTLLCRYYTTCVTSTLNCVESTPFCVTSTHI